MDKIDEKLISVLDVQGRIPITALAKACRIGKETALYRFNRLTAEGILVGHYPLINMYALGFVTSRVYFELQEMTAQMEQQFVRFLDEKSRAGVIFRMDYPYRYGMVLWTRSIYDVERKIVEAKRAFKEYITAYNFTVFCSYKQYSRNYLCATPTPRKVFNFQPTPAKTIDDEDFIILRSLSKDARTTSSSIAQETRIPQTTVSNKIKTLERTGIIVGYRSEIDFIRLGFVNFFLEIYLKDNTALGPIEAWADQSRNVTWLQKIIGTCDIEIEVEVKDRQELEALLNDLRERFPSIRKIVFWSQAYKKMTHLPAD